MDMSTTFSIASQRTRAQAKRRATGAWSALLVSRSVVHGVAMSTIQERIGKRIQQQRDAARLTQAQLADRAGVNAEHISRIERAEKGPSIELLDRVAGALGVSIKALFDFEEEPAEDARKTAIASLLDSTDGRTRDVAEAVLEVLVRKLESRKPVWR